MPPKFRTWLSRPSHQWLTRNVLSSHSTKRNKLWICQNTSRLPSPCLVVFLLVLPCLLPCVVLPSPEELPRLILPCLWSFVLSWFVSRHAGICLFPQLPNLAKGKPVQKGGTIYHLLPPSDCLVLSRQTTEFHDLKCLVLTWLALSCLVVLVFTFTILCCLVPSIVHACILSRQLEELLKPGDVSFSRCLQICMHLSLFMCPSCVCVCLSYFF
jgi:hypothetical protein